MIPNKLPKLYILIHNIQKPKNVGMIIRSCSAFNVEKVFLIAKDIEKKKKSKVMKEFRTSMGSKGTDKKMEYEFFASVEEASNYFKENKITVCGIEITETSESVNSDPWRGDTVLIPGNEGIGMINKLKDICDQFIYIPQYTEKTASLNVGVATSICLQRFANWAGYKEAPIFGEKFLDPELEKEKYDEKIKALQEGDGEIEDCVEKKLKTE